MYHPEEINKYYDAKKFEKKRLLKDIMYNY